MAQDLEAYLETALSRLEIAQQEITKTHGVSEDSETLQLLIELVKEQVPNENTHRTTRQTR